MKSSLKFVGGVALFAAMFFGYLAWEYYGRIYSSNVNLEDSSIEFYIKSTWNYDSVRFALVAKNIIVDQDGFDWVADQKQYPVLIKPGRFLIFDGMSNNRLINLLRSGEQKPVKVIVRSVRTKEQLASQVSKYIEADSASISELLSNANFCMKYGFSESTIITLFLPNTYEFYWNTSAEEFIERMAREYKRFWTDDRKTKAKKAGLTQSEVCILASIVQSEQGAHPDERDDVAGLYLNRLKKGMKLDSDPTLIFALGDFTIKRVLNAHKKVDSPYNTYKNAGLPPGPILLPELSSLDAVLNASDHNYLFMCAKEDFSGYHNFSVSYREHINNARRYQRELNKRKIYR
jgi:UPF0755 protein